MQCRRVRICTVNIVATACADRSATASWRRPSTLLATVKLDLCLAGLLLGSSLSWTCVDSDRDDHHDSIGCGAVAPTQECACTIAYDNYSLVVIGDIAYVDVDFFLRIRF